MPVKSFNVLIVARLCAGLLLKCFVRGFVGV